MEPDAEIFAEMAQDLLLGPSQAQPGPPSAQSAQPSNHRMKTAPQGYLAQDQSQSWQRVSKPQTAPQQPQQMQQVNESFGAHHGFHALWEQACAVQLPATTCFSC